MSKSSSKAKGIFQHLSDFSLIRSYTQAIGFYIVWLVLLVVLGALAGAIIANILNISNSNDQVIGAVIIAIESFTLSLLIISTHKNTKNFGYVILAIGFAIIGYYFGAIIGLLLPAFLTTRK